MSDIPLRMPVQTASNAMLDAIKVIKKVRRLIANKELADAEDNLLKSKICMDLLEHRYGRPAVPEVLTPQQLEDRLVEITQFYTRGYSYDRHRMFLQTMSNRFMMLLHELDEDNLGKPELTESLQDDYHDCDNSSQDHSTP